MKNLFVPTQSNIDKAQVKSLGRTSTINSTMGEETATRMIDDLLLKVEAGLSNFLSHATMEKAISLIETLQKLRRTEVHYRQLKSSMDKKE